jgi:hypothetical protein
MFATGSVVVRTVGDVLVDAGVPARAQPIIRKPFETPVHTRNTRSTRSARSTRKNSTSSTSKNCKQQQTQQRQQECAHLVLAKARPSDLPHPHPTGTTRHCHPPPLPVHFSPCVSGACATCCVSYTGLSATTSTVVAVQFLHPLCTAWRWRTAYLAVAFHRGSVLEGAAVASHARPPVRYAIRVHRISYREGCLFQDLCTPPACKTYAPLIYLLLGGSVVCTYIQCICALPLTHSPPTLESAH